MRIGLFCLKFSLAGAWLAVLVPEAVAQTPDPLGVITTVPTVTEVSQPPARAELLLAQPQTQPLAQPQILMGQAALPIQITGIQLQPSVDGVNIRFATRGGNLGSPALATTGTTLRATLSNATLALANGQTSFEVNRPTVGIASIRVSQATATTVLIEVLGLTELPTAEVALGTCVADRPCDQGLTLALAPGEQELIVTADKRPDNPQDVPISLSVFGREQLRDADVNSVRDVAALTPNFFTSVNDRSFNFQTIRGLGNSNYLSRDALSVYIDDVPYENIHQFLPGELFDLERIEVLRGPQGTLYGRNSQAGVLNIISRPPTNKPEIQFGGGYGNVRQRQVSFSWSDAIIRDQLAFRVATSYSARDGFTRDTLLNQNANPQESIFARAQLQWTPIKDLSISFNANGGRNRDGDNTFVPIDQANPFVSDRNIPGSLDVGINTQSLRIAYAGKSVNLTAITARNSTSLNYRQDSDYSPVDLLRSAARIPSTIWSQEVRLQSANRANRLQWQVGGYFQSRSLDLFLSTEYTPLVASLGFPVGLSRTDALFDQRTYALFGQVEFKPISVLTLTAGLRYERFTEQLDLSNSFTPPGLSAIPDGLNLRNSEVAGDILLPRFGVQYQPTPDLMLYGTIARGYKPGTQSFGATSLATLSVDPEKLWSYELGVKSTWFNRRLTANFAAFWSEIDDYQVLLIDNSGLSTFIASGGARTYGLELELNAKIREGLNVIAGFGYTNARFTDYTNPFSGQSFNSNRLAFAPEYTFNLGVQYRHRRGLFARIDLQGLGRYFFDDANTLKQDPVVLLNARIGYEYKGLGIYLYANNLGNATYVTTAFEGFFANLASYGDRRTFGFQARASF